MIYNTTEETLRKRQETELEVAEVNAEVLFGRDEDG